MFISLVIFLLGVLGFVLNRKNIIIIIISIEIILLSVTLLIVLHSYNYDDIIGLLFGVFIIVIAGAESAIGLALLVSYYRINGNISIA